MARQRQFSKVLLISPPGKVYIYPDGSPAHRKHCSPPLGIAYLAASLEKFDYKVECLDILVEGYEQEEYVEPFIIYGLPLHETMARIRAAAPDVIGVSILFSMVIKEVYELCAAIKKEFPHTPIVLGGHHPTGAAMEVMSHLYVDFAMMGEADVSLVDLLDALNGRRPIESVKGLYYRKDGAIRNTLEGVTPVVAGNGWNYYRRGDDATPTEIGKLPFPAWHLFPMEKYWGIDVRTGGGDSIRERYAVMLSTRGCPHVCYYCSSPLTSGYRNYRKRTNEDVLEEIQWLVDEYGIEEVQFLDDNFYVSKKRVKDLLAQIAERFPNVFFQVTAGTEVNALDDEMIEIMDKANFRKVLLAIEAGDETIQQALIEKKVKLHRVPAVVEKLKAHRIETRGLFMMGFPGETRAQIQKTIDLARALDLDDFNLSIVTAMPGTPLYDECLEKGLFFDTTDLNNFRFSSSSFRLPDMTPMDLEGLRRSVWREAFDEKQRRRAEVTGGKVKHHFADISTYEKMGFQTKVGPRIQTSAPGQTPPVMI